MPISETENISYLHVVDKRDTHHVEQLEHWGPVQFPTNNQLYLCIGSQCYFLKKKALVNGSCAVM